MPYDPNGGSGNALADAAARERKAASKKKPAKKKSGGGFLGTGVGPNVHVNLGVGNVIRDVGAIPGAVGGVVAHMGKAVGYELAGQHDLAKKNLGEVGKVSLGLGSSVVGTLSDVADVVTAPVSVALDQATGRGTGAWLRQLYNKGLDAAAVDPNVAKQYAAKGFAERYKERGLLSPLVEDVGNVALVASAGTGALKAGSRAADAAGLERTAFGLAKAAEKVEPFKHPLQGSYKNTVGQLARAAADEVRPLGATDTAVTGYYDRFGKKLGMRRPGEADISREMPPERGAALAAAYEKLPLGGKTDLATRRSYAALSAETDAQFQYLTAPESQGGLGVTVEYVDRANNPYALPDGSTDLQAMLQDVNKNKHIYVDKTSPGEGHPILSPEQNDRFRAVHDVFGHSRALNDFGRHGEEVAFQSHARMYSPEARRALASETRGQNAWLNFSNENQARVAAGQGKEFGPQRQGLMPEQMAAPEFTRPEDTAGMRAAAERLHEPPSAVAKKIVGPMPEAIKSALRKLERGTERRVVKRAYADERRLGTADRNEAIRSDAMAATIEALNELTSKRGIKRGTGATMISDELRARLEGTKDFFPGEVTNDVAKAGYRAGAPQRIPAERMTPELATKLDAAEQLWRQQGEANLQTQLNNSRLGNKGLENVGQETPSMTRGEQRLYREATKLARKAARIRGRLPKEESRLYGQLVKAEAQSQILLERIGKYQGVRNAAAEKLDTLRPGTPTPEPGGPPTPGKLFETGQEPGPASARQLASRTKGAPGETSARAVKRGVQLGYTVRDIEEANARIAQQIAAHAKVSKVVETMKTQLIEHDLPAAAEAAAVDARAARSFQKLTRGLENASVSRWPRRWQPIGRALDRMRTDALTNPELADVMEQLPETFPEVVRRAQELGLDPTYVAEMSDMQVKRAVYGSMRLFKAGREGMEVTGGFRKQNTGGLSANNAVDRSVEALVAATVETMKETRTNHLVDFIESHLAIQVKPGDPMPKHYVAWDPIRTNLLNGKSLDGEFVIGQQVRYIVPKTVLDTLHGLTKDYSHGAFRMVQRVTNPWRAFVLTLSPRWYVNNFLGNFALASIEGVKMQDWTKAWHSFRDKSKGYRFSDVPAVTGHSFVSDIGETSIIPKAPGSTALRQAIGEADGGLSKLNAARRQLGHTMRRANEAVDEIARSAVYHKTIRTTGDAVEAAQRAYIAQIDYGNLSPFEHDIVRSVIPFYSWQKGILALAARLPMDHPLAVGIVMNAARQFEDELKRKFGGEVPTGYSGLIMLPGGGALNPRGANPLQDSASLLTVDGIAGSLNPFLALGLRKALGAPEGGFIDQYRMDPYGLGIPDVNVGKSFVTDLAGGTPLAQLAESVGGFGRVKAGPVQQTGRFLGVPYMNKDDVQRAVDRAAAARGMIETGSPFPQSTAKKKPAPVKLPSALSRTTRGTKLPWQR